MWCRSVVNFSSVLCLATCRMRSSPCDTVARFCARSVLCWLAFPSAPALGSTDSAADRSAAFTGFTATTAGSDFSRSCIIGYGSSPSRCGPWGRRVHRPNVRPPRFRRLPFVRDVFFDHGRASVPRIAGPHMLPSTLLTGSASAILWLSRLNSTPHTIAVYASHPPSPATTQHSLPGARYGLPGPVSHRQDNASLPGAQAIQSRRGHHLTSTTTIPDGRIGELVRYFLRLGFLGFGGPVALVGQMERELVDERKWLTKEQMRESIAICQSLPGPLAIQVGIYVSYLRGGFWGAWAGGWAFILPNFVIVAALGALYVYLGDLQPVTGAFYGVSPAVIALILHSCYRLAKLGMEDWLQWAIAAVCLVVTVILQAEVALLFIGAGIVGILYYGSLFKRTPTG